MSVKIYGSSHSRSLRVLWMLEEMGFPYEHNPIGFEQCGSDTAYVALNPAGTIPCLVEDNFILAESLAINLYLAEKAPALLPPNGHARALALQWSFFAATSLEHEYMIWALHSVWMPESDRSPNQAALALKELQRPLDRLEIALKDGAWLVGNEFTVADLNVAGVINLLQGHLSGSHPAVEAWLQRCLSRQAYLTATQKP